MFGMVGNPTFYARLAFPNKALGRVLACACMFVRALAHSMASLPDRALSLDGSTLDPRRTRSRRARRPRGRDRRRRAPGGRPRVARRSWTTRWRAGDVVYGVNTGFGNFADVRIPRRPAARAAAEPRAQPRRGRRRAARRGRDARPHAAARQRAGQGLQRRAAGDARPAWSPCSTRGVHPVVPVAGLGRRERRSRPARPPRAGPHRRRRVRATTGGARRPAPRRWRAAGLAPVVLEAKEGLALINGTQLMTAVAGARPRRGLAPRAQRRRHRRADPRRAQGHGRRLRPAHPRRAPAPGPGGLGAQPARACSRAAPSASRTATAARCRTRTPCAACRRCTAPSATRSPT